MIEITTNRTPTATEGEVVRRLRAMPATERRALILKAVSLTPAADRPGAIREAGALLASHGIAFGDSPRSAPAPRPESLAKAVNVERDPTLAAQPASWGGHVVEGSRFDRLGPDEKQAVVASLIEQAEPEARRAGLAVHEVLYGRLEAVADSLRIERASVSHAESVAEASRVRRDLALAYSDAHRALASRQVVNIARGSNW